MESESEVCFRIWSLKTPIIRKKTDIRMIDYNNEGKHFKSGFWSEEESDRRYLTYPENLHNPENQEKNITQKGVKRHNMAIELLFWGSKFKYHIHFYEN